MNEIAKEQLFEKLRQEGRMERMERLMLEFKAEITNQIAKEQLFNNLQRQGERERRAIKINKALDEVFVIPATTITKKLS